MRVLVVGGGGREHAIIKSLKKSSKIDTIFALPGNGGIAEDATCVDIAACDIDGIVKFAVDNNIEFAVVAPDDPLVLGAVDKLHAAGIKCFGPDSRAAAIEGSKVFSKGLMKKYNIPTAAYEVFSDKCSAIEYLKSAKHPIVIKADGLALGKGVIISNSTEESVAAVTSIMEDKIFGDSGNNIVIEEFLTGPEVSVLAFTDGKTLRPMVSSMDHKRAHDGDTGLNTGGMGTVAPNPCYTDDIAKVCMEKIFLPTIEAMKAEGRTFKGCLYFGLMLTKDGPKVIEYNCRFGDPEAQSVLSLLKSDLLDIMLAVENETLEDAEVEFDSGAACCVMLCSGGYPTKYNKGLEMNLGNAANMADINLYHSGTALKDGKLVTSGGRVLGVTATAETLEDALGKAYDAAKQISFTDMFYRKDIGQKALSFKKTV